jgi:lambda family phage portal protein
MAAPAIVLGPDGTPARRAAVWNASAPYRGGDRTSQELAGWHPALLSGNAELLPYRDDLVARGRDLVRNNGFAAGIQQTLLDSVIGAGWRLTARPNWRALGITYQQAREWGNLIEALWRAQADDPACWIDAGRRMRFTQLLWLQFVSWAQAGEHLSLALWLDRGARYRTCLQPIDPDRLSNPWGMPDSPTLRGGVEMDVYGAPIAYHIRGGHPGDMVETMRAAQWTRVPRETEWGRPMVLHGFRVERDGQARGRPGLAPVIEALRLQDVYERAEASAAVLNAIFAAFIETQAGLDPELVEKMFGAEENGTDTAGRPNVEIRVQGTRVPQLPVGTAMKFLTPQRPSTAFGPFEDAVLRRIAAGSGLSYEQVSKDYSKTNYSSARASLLEAWRFCTGTSEFFASTFADHTYALWLEEAVDAGRAPLPPGVTDFYQARAELVGCAWIGPGRGQIDPTKETQAAEMRVGVGISSRTREAALLGADFEEISEERAAEEKVLKDLGLGTPGDAFFGVQHASDREAPPPARESA